MKYIILLFFIFNSFSACAQKQVVKRKDMKTRGISTSKNTTVKTRKVKFMKYETKTSVSTPRPQKTKRIKKDVSNAQYDYVGDFSNGYSCVRRNDKWGYINKTGQEVIPCTFDVYNDFSDGIALVCLNGKWGLIDGYGNVIVPFKYDWGRSEFHEGLIGVRFDGKWGFINEQGKCIIPCKYEFVGDFCDGLSRVQFNGAWGYINSKGDYVIPCKYNLRSSCVYVDDFQDGLVAVYDDYDSKSYFLDKTGNRVAITFPTCCTGFRSFREGYSSGYYTLSGKYGFINKEGKASVPFIYDEVGDFHEGLAKVKYEGKWGFVDYNGSKVVPYIYDEVTDFKDSLACVRFEDKWGFVDKTGKEVIECKFGNKQTGNFEFNEGLALVMHNGKWGYINKTGEEVIPFEFSKARSFKEDVAIVLKNGRWGIIDKKGQIIYLK